MAGNHEFGCISEDSGFISACSSYFERLWDAAGQDVTVEQLDAWDAEVTAFLALGGRPVAEVKLPDHGVLISVEPPPTTAPAGWPAESGQAFVKFFGQGNSRLPRNFEVFEEVRRAGCHWACTYPRERRPRQVADGDTLFTGRLVEGPNDTLIFGRAIGMAYVQGRDDATPQEIAARPWKTQWPHYIRVHHGEFVAGSLSNGVSLGGLMDALGADAFASTQENRRRGVGNVNPRAAFRQQAAVRLSREGAAELTSRLERAFDVHGTLPADQLATLDWPK